MIKIRIWTLFYLISLLICFLFSVRFIHFELWKKRTLATIDNVEKLKANSYQFILSYNNGEEKRRVNITTKKSRYEKIKSKTLVPIYYSEFFKNQVYFVEFSPSFLGRTFMFFFLGVLFLISFKVSLKELRKKSNRQKDLKGKRKK